MVVTNPTGIRHLRNRTASDGNGSRGGGGSGAPLPPRSPAPLGGSGSRRPPPSPLGVAGSLPSPGRGGALSPVPPPGGGRLPFRSAVGAGRGLGLGLGLGLDLPSWPPAPAPGPPHRTPGTAGGASPSPRRPRWDRGGGGAASSPPYRGRIAAAVASALVLGAMALVVSSWASSSAAAAAARDREVMEDMADRIASLSRELGSARRRAEDVEEREREVEEELGRVRSLEEKERGEIKARGEEIERLMAEVRAASAERGAAGLRGGGADGGGGKAEELRQNLLKVQRSIQSRDRAAVLGLFGPGPHRVKVELEFPPGAPEGTGEDNSDANAFVIEMASLQLMPHSVRLFLEQVSAGLYNNCSFYRNPPHIVQAEPATVEGDTAPLQRFAEKDLEHVSFREYSKEFPHVPYTVGYAGEHGKWYINKLDNTKEHGPGGQVIFGHTADPEPCFGMVVSGRNAVDRLWLMPVDKTKPGERMRERVRIVSATVVVTEPQS